MRLTASDIFGLYRPTECELRVYLRQRGVKDSESGAFDQILEALGERHEKEHLATLGPYENLSAVPADQPARLTAEAARNRAPVIYQGELACGIVLHAVPLAIVGRPDFPILDGDGSRLIIGSQRIRR